MHETLRRLCLKHWWIAEQYHLEVLKSTGFENEFKQPDEFREIIAALGRDPPTQDVLFNAQQRLQMIESNDPIPTGRALFCLSVLIGGVDDPLVCFSPPAFSKNKECKILTIIICL